MFRIIREIHPLKAVLYCLLRLRFKDALSIFDYNYRHIKNFKYDFSEEDFEIYYPDEEEK